MTISSISYKIKTCHPSTQSISKRLLDIGGSLVGLLILAILFIPVAVAIKLDSPGPILYKQRRCGLLGKPFTIYKFRTMVQNAEALKYSVFNEATGPIFKNHQDPRITKVGHFLRTTSLDELPQFWNVLIGEMSLVGTRPPTFDEIKQYNSHHWRRLEVKPGITGEWQVNGRSAIRNFEEIVELDLRYQRRWTLWYDLVIIFQTFYIVLGKMGAF